VTTEKKVVNFFLRKKMHPGDLAGGFSDLEMTWLLYCAGTATDSECSHCPLYLARCDIYLCACLLYACRQHRRDGYTSGPEDYQNRRSEPWRSRHHSAYDYSWLL